MKDDQAKRGRVNWKGADLRGTNWVGVNLEGMDFRASDCRGANFTCSNLRYCDFRGADVRGANFQNALLYGPKMQGVEADHADFRGADVRLANFGGAYLAGAIMPAPTAELPHPWPSEIAKANRQQPEQEPAHDNSQSKSNGQDAGHSM